MAEGDIHKERKDEEKAKGRGEPLGGGGWIGETEEITVHEINILVPKGINKDSELSSVQGTQDITTAWIFDLR